MCAAAGERERRGSVCWVLVPAREWLIMDWSQQRRWVQNGWMANAKSRGLAAASRCSFVDAGRMGQAAPGAIHNPSEDHFSPLFCRPATALHLLYIDRLILPPSTITITTTTTATTPAFLLSACADSELPAPLRTNWRCALDD